MARPLRIEFPGAFYHVTSRGNEKRTVFQSIGDRERFLSYLKSAHDRYGATIHVYCLMLNHYHLLLETPRGNLSQILHHINGAYTTYFNRRRERVGHLFQGRYKAILVEKDAYCEELSRYIHLNPVRAGFVRSPSEYRWSSFRSYTGGAKTPEWLTTRLVLGYFKDSPRRYRAFVEESLGQNRESPLRSVLASTILGTDGFIEKVKALYLGHRRLKRRDVPAVRQILSGPSLEEIDRTVEETIENDPRLSKKFRIYFSHRYSGLSLSEIGKHLGMEGAAISQSSRRLRRAIAAESELRRLTRTIGGRLGLFNVET